MRLKSKKNAFMRLILLFLLTTVTFHGNAQICNFCRTENLKEVLIAEGLSFDENIDHNGENIIKSTGENYTKIWHFRYQQCYLYEVLVFKKGNFKSMVKVLNSQFYRKSKTVWEDPENRVELTEEDNHHKFSFYPKPSALQGITNQ